MEGNLMREKIGWIVLCRSCVCSAVCFWIEGRERNRSATVWDDVDSRMYKNPRFVAVVVLGLLFAGIGMYLVGVFTR